jgi:FkbH-like protein
VSNNLRIINARPYKLIILDCDNTLWGGILDEDKAEGIRYGNYDGGVIFKEFQNILKKLKKKGFLLSISSKNNEESVWTAMKHKKMILQKKDFLNPKINWDEKYINIKKTLSELSLRPSDTIFIDDNILEIKKVKKFIKGINCLHINSEINIKKNITDNPRFQKLTILEEDIKKYKQYKIKFKYEKLKKNNKNNSIFFKKLKQKIKFFNCNKSNFERALQLFIKTNQFNFSLNRYSGVELKKIISDVNYDVKLFDLNDRFGNHGVVGSYIVKKKTNTIEIIDLVLSCRVFNRYVEDYIIWHICKTYKARKILINYLSTDLNNKLIPKFLKNKYFVLKNKINNIYTYQVILNKNLNEIKNIFNNQN